MPRPPKLSAHLLVPCITLACLLSYLAAVGPYGLPHGHNAAAAARPLGAIVVTNTDDSGAGSLRDAIQQANTDGMPTTITFNAALAGQAIQLQSPLPTLNEDGTTIDGDTNANCVPDIELDGAAAGPGADGIVIPAAANCVIRGLIINRFSGTGVNLFGPTVQNNHVECNYIGTNLAHATNRGNATGVRIGNAATDNQIGPSNTIAYNAASGIDMTDGSLPGYPDFTGLTPDYTNRFPSINFPATSGPFRSIDGIRPVDGAGHFFGDNFGARFTGTLSISATGSYTFTVPTPDDQVRILVDSTVILNASCCTTASTTVSLSAGDHSIELDYFDGPGAANLTLNITGAGTATLSTGGQPGLFGEFFQLRIPTERNRITLNSINNNNNLGINLDAIEDGFGVNFNDFPDNDLGPNTALNFPVLNFITDNGGGSFTLQGTAPPNATVEVFGVGITGDPSGHGEGGTFLASTTANGGGGFSVTFTTPGGINFVTATATDALGNTSEFAHNRQLTQSRWGQTPLFSNIPDISGPAGYVTGDLNGDGRLDLVAAGNSGPSPNDCRLLVLLQNGSGQYPGVSQEPLGAGQGLCQGNEALALGDVDADGDLDLVAQGRDNSSTSQLLLLLNDGTGNFNSGSSIFAPGLTQGGVAFGDVDGDGDLDLAATGRDGTNASRFLLFTNNGGALTLTQEPAGAGDGFGDSSIVFGDLDSDNDLDLLVGGDNNTFADNLVLYRNDGSGGFSAAQQLMSPGSGLGSAHLRLADLDRDGDLDLLAAGRVNNAPAETRKRILKFTNTSGSFGGSLTVATMSIDTNLAGLAVGDVNGDGYPDAFVNANDGFSFQLFYYQSQAGTLVENDPPEATFVGPVIFGDFDADNDLDLVGLPVRQLFTNLLGPANSAPGVPPSPAASISPTNGETTLSWSSATDAESTSPALAYEVRLGTSSGNYNVLSGVYGTPLMGNHPLGRRGVAQPGRRLRLGAGTYFWQVRAIDTGLRAGAWTSESSFTVQPSIVINDTSVNEGNAGTTQANFTVTLLNGTGPTTVDYTTANGDAFAPSDYTATSGTLSLTPAAPTQTISVNVNGDTVGEADETYIVNLSNATGAVLGRGQGFGDILNDDPPPVININDVSTLEGNTGTRALNFTVYLTSAWSQNITVQYATADGSALAGSDYVAASGTLTFMPGETTKTIPITINGDTTAEPLENFSVNLSNATGAVINDNQGNGSIVDDEAGTKYSTAANWFTAQEGMPALNAVASNGSTYVIIGVAGEIWSSPDTVNWTKRTNPDTFNRPLNGLTYGGGQFVAVGGATSSAGPLILTSPDGITWTLRSALPSQRTLARVAFGNGLYVATVGQTSGRALTSPDGINWTERVIGVGANFNSIAYGNGLFVAVAQNRTVATTPDGINWTLRGGIPPVVSFLSSITFTGSQFVCVSRDPSGFPDTGSGIMTSPDGINWTQRTAPTNQPLQGVTSGNGLIVAVGTASGLDRTIITSPDGINWMLAPQQDEVGVSPSLRGVVFGNTGFVAIGGRGGIYASPDGTSLWVSRTLQTSRSYRGVAHDGATFCAVGINGALSSSPDGVNWTPRTPPDPNAYFFWFSVTHANGLFVATGISDSIMTSPDCVNWTVRNPITPLVPDDATGSLTDIAYGNGTFVAIGETVTSPTQTDARIFTSPDGINWTPRNTGLPSVSSPGYATAVVAYGNGQFVAQLTENNSGEFIIITSPDGVTWTRQTVPPVFDQNNIEGFLDMIYANGEFVGVGDRIWTSLDGVNWALRFDYPVPPNFFFTGVAFGDNRFVAVGINGQIYASDDALSWSPQTSATAHNLFGVTCAANGTRFVAVGESAIEYTEFTPALAISDVSVNEGNAGLTPLQFTVALSVPVPQQVTVNFCTADGTAVAPFDYTSACNTLTIPPNSPSGTITVNALGDLLNETDEDFFVNLSNPTGAVITDGQAVGTIVNDDPLPTLSVNDVFVAEPAAGTTTATFNVSLSAPSGRTVTVNYATQDDTANAGSDYQQANGMLTFPPGVVSQPVSVTVLSDAFAESNETFFVNLSNPTNADINDPQGTGTITPLINAGQVIVSEFRFRGPTFSAPQGIGGEFDEFIELYNNTNLPLTVATTDGSPGWALVALTDGGTTATPLVVIPSGFTLPQRSHYLVVNQSGGIIAPAPVNPKTRSKRRGPPASITPLGQYSLDAYAVGDAFYDNIDIPDNAGVALFRTANPANFNAANRLDAAGFAGQTGALPDLFREGAGLQSPGASDGQYSFVRLLTTGLSQDTDNNANDFAFVSTNGGNYGGVQSQLGAPGPENLSSPIQRNTQIKPSLVDPQQLSTAPPNRVRDTTANVCGNPNTCAQGTLTFRRKFRNSTGNPVNRLRFRIVDVTTLNTPNPGGAQADLRLLDSTDVSVQLTGGGSVLVKGTLLEQPPAQSLGGGLNTSLVVNLPGGALANGASINVQFVLGVQTGGRFRFLVNVEALP